MMSWASSLRLFSYPRLRESMIARIGSDTTEATTLSPEREYVVGVFVSRVYYVGHVVVRAR